MKASPEFEMPRNYLIHQSVHKYFIVKTHHLTETHVPFQNKSNSFNSIFGCLIDANYASAIKSGYTKS